MYIIILTWQIWWTYFQIFFFNDFKQNDKLATFLKDQLNFFHVLLWAFQIHYLSHLSHWIKHAAVINSNKLTSTLTPEILHLPVQSLQLFLTLCNSMDCSLPCFSVHGISQARILEWVAMPFSTYAYLGSHYYQ